jgi:hypothetical protein
MEFLYTKIVEHWTSAHESIILSVLIGLHCVAGALKALTTCWLGATFRELSGRVCWTGWVMLIGSLSGIGGWVSENFDNVCRCGIDSVSF